MSTILIRPVRREDCPEVERLIRELARYERLEHECHASVENLERELFCERPVIRAVLAWEVDEAGKESAIGFALYFFNFSTFLTKRGLYLEDLFVREAWRGRGVGRSLLKHLAAEAVREGCGRFDWVVLDWNRPAIDFYRRMGANILEDWRICRVEGEALKRLAE